LLSRNLNPTEEEFNFTCNGKNNGYILSYFPRREIPKAKNFPELEFEKKLIPREIYKAESNRFPDILEFFE